MKFILPKAILKLLSKGVYLLICLFFFTGCFEIIEEIEVRENGSGRFEYTVNMSRSSLQLATIMELDSSKGYRIPSKREVIGALGKFEQRLKEIEGLQNVKVKKDFKDFVFSVSYDFDSLAAMNRAVFLMVNFYDKKNELFKESYRLEKTSFTRIDDEALQKGVKNLFRRNTDILTDADYISIFRGVKKIESSNHSKTKISSNGTNAMLKLKFGDMLSGIESIEQKIEF